MAPKRPCSASVFAGGCGTRSRSGSRSGVTRDVVLSMGPRIAPHVAPRPELFDPQAVEPGGESALGRLPRSAVGNQVLQSTLFLVHEVAGQRRGVGLFGKQQLINRQPLMQEPQFTGDQVK